MFTVPLKVENIESDDPLDRDRLAVDLNDELQALGPGNSLTLAKRRLGGFAAVDPSILDFVLQLGASGTLAAVLGAVVRILISRQRARSTPYRVKVGDASVDLPSTATSEDVENIVAILAAGVKRPRGSTVSQHGNP